jgi:RNA recognition motif-containing protein
MENTVQLKCRKCGGKHLTIKCGINLKEVFPLGKTDFTGKIEEKKEENSFIKKDNFFHKYDKTTYKVKISNLPKDIEYEELHDLLRDWGVVLKINIKTYYDTTLAIIEFKNKNEQEYFIEALNNTSFEHNIINIVKLEY